MAAQGREHPRVAEPVTAIVEGESLGDVLLDDGRLYRIVEVYDGGRQGPGRLRTGYGVRAWRPC